ncbi:MFS transporter [Mycobacterium asiaticum]|uniref:MFS transporter n=2 Tax=Mycobacterium asiaticum TaxID=1790 RepID=A0A1A3NPI6_MYCAS|nr:MFS transporter [Mycobacterium asiaticum]
MITALATATAFLLFAQIFMVAPLVPTLAREFSASAGLVGLGVPAYLVPYGLMVLLWGPLSDRWGRRRIILVSLVLFVAMVAVTPLVRDVGQFIVLRMATGIGAGGVVPISVALVGDLVPYQRRGRVLGWMCGGMAGGTAFGAAGGALGEPLLGWRGLFTLVAVFACALLTLSLWLIPDTTPKASNAVAAGVAVTGFRGLLRLPRARRTYGYVLINAMLHAGIYSWLGVYLQQRAALNEAQLGLILLGYGVPGLLLGPAIGLLADRYGRARIIPLGLAVAGVSAATFASEPSLVVAQSAIIILSLGYDMTQPPLVGIVTDLPGNRGQAIALNSCVLWVGMGIGSLVFQAILMPWGFHTAFGAFAAVALVGAVIAIPMFRTERPASAIPISGGLS